VGQLLSKLVAGGLSAAVILIWWPRFFPVDSVETWMVRGVVWTLLFEVLLHALAPFERSLWQSAAAHRVRRRAAAAGRRLAFHNPHVRVRGRGAMACAAVAIPAFLLATAPAPPPKEKPVAAKTVQHVTQIKRVVRVEEPQPGAPVAVSADPAARPEAPAAAPAQPAAPVRHAAPAARKRSTPRPAHQSTPVKQQPSGGGGSGSGSTPAAGATQGTNQPQESAPVREPQLTGTASQRAFAG
jgi:hypothetical protein